MIDGGSAVPAVLPTDPVRFQLECVDAFVTSWVVRGFSPVTITNDTGVLERLLSALGKPVWEATPDDVDRVVGAMAADGLAASTRRGYVQVLKGFHRFLVARRAAEIEAAFGVRLSCPVHEFNASRHVGSDSPREPPPTTTERVDAFFAFLKERIASARKYASAGRDYALFRALYHAGLRGATDEAFAMRWQLFDGNPTQAHYDDLRRTAERTGDWPGARDKAIGRLRDATIGQPAYADHLIGVYLDEGELDEAWQVAADRAEELFDSRWQQLIDLRQPTHPQDVIEPWQRLIQRRLDAGTDKYRYGKAITMLRQLRDAYRAIGDATGSGTYLDHLRNRHNNKTAFIAKLDHAGL